MLKFEQKEELEVKRAADQDNITENWNDNAADENKAVDRIRIAGDSYRRRE